jgi:MFS family permease
MEKKEDKIRKSLKYSVLDGAFYSSMVGFGESFFSAFAVFLKATNIQLGVIGSLPQALGSVLQLISNWLIGVFRSRKRMVVFFASIQGIMYIPVALAFFMGGLKVWFAALFICLYWISGSLLSPAWNSWMGDLVKRDERGAYFGSRNKISGLASFAAFVLGGYILQRFGSGTATEYIGFLAVFFLALVSRIVSVAYLAKKFEPGYRVAEKHHIGFMGFLKEARHTNYGLFVLYLGIMNASVYISAPFFTPYMLNELGFDYLTFTIITAVAIVVKFIAMPIWGKLSDIYGTRKVLSVSGFLMPFVPILWIFSPNVWYLIAVQVYAGFAWAGFEIASFNFIYDSTTHSNRASYVAYFNALNGVLIFAGAMLGSAVVTYFRGNWSTFLLVFLISYVARSLASIFFLPKLREVRHVQKITYQGLLVRAVNMMPSMGMLHHLITFGVRPGSEESGAVGKKKK